MKNQKISPPAPTLVAWIGHADLKAAEGEIGAGVGPIAQAVAFKDCARIVLLSDYPEDRTWWEYLEFSMPVLIEGESGTGEGFVGAGDSRKGPDRYT